MFQKIYEKHVTFGGEGGSLEEPGYVKRRGGSKSGLKKATWFVYGPLSHYPFSNGEAYKIL